MRTSLSTPTASSPSRPRSSFRGTRGLCAGGSARASVVGQTPEGSGGTRGTRRSADRRGARTRAAARPAEAGRVRPGLGHDLAAGRTGEAEVALRALTDAGFHAEHVRVKVVAGPLRAASDDASAGARSRAPTPRRRSSSTSSITATSCRCCGSSALSRHLRRAAPDARAGDGGLPPASRRDLRRRRSPRRTRTSRRSLSSPVRWPDRCRR